jgi:hypothetical protein
MDFQKRECQVVGVSSVSLVRECDPKIHPAGMTFPLSEIGPLLVPEPLESGISSFAWELVRSALPSTSTIDEAPPDEVVTLAEARQAARLRKDWAAADDYRRQLTVLGWIVQDTPEGFKLVKN